MGSKSLFIQDCIYVYGLNMATVFFKKKFIFSGMVFAADRVQNAINLKPLSLHLLVVTSTLIVISGFDEIRHDSKHFVEDGILSVLELISENLKKDSIFDFLFFGPMSFSFVDGFLIIGDFVKVKRWVINRNKICHCLDINLFK